MKIAAKLEIDLRAVEDWTIWEIVAYVDGRNEAYGASGPDVKPMTDEEFDDLLEKHNVSHMVN